MVRAKRSRHLANFPEWAWHFDETQWPGSTVLNRWLAWVEAIVEEANADDRSKRYRLDWLRVRRNLRRTAAHLQGPDPDDLDKAVITRGIRLTQAAEWIEFEERLRRSQEMFPRGWGENEKTKALMADITREWAREQTETMNTPKEAS